MISMIAYDPGSAGGREGGKWQIGRTVPCCLSFDHPASLLFRQLWVSLPVRRRVAGCLEWYAQASKMNVKVRMGKDDAVGHVRLS